LIRPWVADQSDLVALTQSLRVIGDTGVDLFFVLSGYLIYGSLIARRQAFLPFISRRIERIYPAFVVVFALYVALAFAFPMENKIPGNVVDGALYLVANVLLLPGLFPIRPLNTVAWSLSYEMFFYLVIPLTITVFRLRDRTPAFRSAFFSVLA